MLMMTLLLILVPAPRDEPLPFIGYWDAKWSGGPQTMEFLPNGIYKCPTFCNGSWVYDRGVVYFTEGEASYWMIVDWSVGEGMVGRSDYVCIWSLTLRKRKK